MRARQSSKIPRRALGGVAAAFCTAVLLAGCAATPAEAPAGAETRPAVPPTSESAGGSEQTVQEACAVSRQRVEDAINALSQRITEAQSAATNGEFPDLAAIANEFGTGIGEATSLVTNAQVHEAVGKVGGEVLAFGSIQTPESLIGVPGYIDALIKQGQRANTAREELTALCS